MIERKGIHQDKEEIFCNRCSRYMDKLTETMVLEDEVYCLTCNNWLCGFFDAFGDVEKHTISIVRIKRMAKQWA